MSRPNESVPSGWYGTVSSSPMRTAVAGREPAAVLGLRGADDERGRDDETCVVLRLDSIAVDGDDRIPVAPGLEIEAILDADLARIEDLRERQPERAIGLGIVDVAVDVIARRRRTRAPTRAAPPASSRARRAAARSARAAPRRGQRLERDAGPRRERLDDPGLRRQPGRAADQVEILRRRIDAPQPRPRDGEERERDDDDQREQRAPVALQALPSVLPIRQRRPRQPLRRTRRP